MAVMLADPEMGGTPFSVWRRTYVKEMGETLPSRTEYYDAVGCIQPASPAELALFPEEEGVEDMIIVLSAFAFQLGKRYPEANAFTVPDEVHWGGSRYQVLRVADWFREGGYYKAWAKRQPSAA